MTICCALNLKIIHILCFVRRVGVDQSYLGLILNVRDDPNRELIIFKAEVSFQ